MHMPFKSLAIQKAWSRLRIFMRLLKKYSYTIKISKYSQKSCELMHI